MDGRLRIKNTNAMFKIPRTFQWEPDKIKQFFIFSSLSSMLCSINCTYNLKHITCNLKKSNTS